MTSREIYNDAMNFVELCRKFKISYAEAENNEKMPNEATQDFLHVVEFTPNELRGMDIVTILHRLREQRREAKSELEAMEIFKNWSTVNFKAVNDLQSALIKMRQIHTRQNTGTYRFRTNYFGEQDRWVQKPEVEDEEEYMPEFLLETEDV